MQRLAPAEFKTCCTSLYANKAVLFLLGPSLHPGGQHLSNQLAIKLGLSESDRVLDLACGMGATVSFLELNYKCAALGIDLSRELTKSASTAFKTGKLGFANADGENLPFGSESFSVVLSECSLCLMPDTATGLREAFRVLKKGGRLGITDIAVEGPLPDELDNVLASFLCLTRKITSQKYAKTLEVEGFEKNEVSDESKSLANMLEGIRKRLLIAELMTGIRKMAVPEEEIEKGKRLVRLATSAVNDHALGYIMLTAAKP